MSPSSTENAQDSSSFSPDDVLFTLQRSTTSMNRKDAAPKKSIKSRQNKQKIISTMDPST